MKDMKHVLITAQIQGNNKSGFGNIEYYIPKRGLTIDELLKIKKEFAFKFAYGTNEHPDNIGVVIINIIDLYDEENEEP